MRLDDNTLIILRQDVEAGARAEKILEFIAEDLAEQRKEIVKIWENSREDEEKLREQCYTRIQAIRMIERKYRADVEAGELAAIQLKQIEEQKNG